MMELEAEGEGKSRLKLGLVEKVIVWLVGVVVVALIGTSITWVVRTSESTSKGRDEISAKLGALTTQQAVTNIQLAQINIALQDIPGLRATSAETKIRVDRIEQDVKELRQVRQLR